MNQKLKYPLFFLSFMLFSHFLYSDSFENAENAFRANKMQEAIRLFEIHLQEPHPNPLTYNYLALAYYKISDKKKAVDVLLEGVGKNDTDKRLLYYNAGNIAFSMGLYNDAENYFSLSNAVNPSFSNALLNRANTRVKLMKFLPAIEDYQAYLVLEPQSPQKAKIEQMLNLLQNELQDLVLAEERRLLEEERIRAEQERQAEIQKAEQELLAEKQREEALRRQKLMDEIAASLQNTESANVRAGTEGVMEYDYEFELD